MRVYIQILLFCAIFTTLMSVSGRKRTTRLGEDEGMTSEDRMWGDKSGNEVSSNDVKTKKYRKQGNKYNSKNIRRGVHEPLDETSQSEESGVARNWKNSKSQKQRKYEFLKWSGKKKVRGVGEDGFFESRGDSEKMVKKKKISEEVVKEKLTPYEKWAQKNKKKYEKFYGSDDLGEDSSEEVVEHNDWESEEEL